MPAARYEIADRVSVLQSLEQFARASVDIWGSADDFLGGRAESERDEVLELDLVQDAWVAWVIVDDPKAAVLPRFHRRYAGRLTPGQRRYLDCLAATRMRVYTVVAVDPDEALHLRDLLDREDVTVTERKATQQVVPGDVIAARLIAGKTPGTTEFEHPVIPFTQLDAEPLLKDIRSLRRRLRRENEDLADEMLRVAIPMLVNEYWIDCLEAAADLRARGLSALQTTDGDPIAFRAVTFAVRDRDALLERLRADERFSPNDENGFTWLEPNGDERRVLGDVKLARNELRGEVLSAERAARLRDELTLLAGEHATFRAIEPIDPSTVERAPAAVDAPEIPAEIQAQILGEYYTRHYATWPDEPLPMFSGLTPREAVTRPSLRPRLIALLRDMDASSERQRLSGGFVYDFTPVWHELGLERSRLGAKSIRRPQRGSASRTF